MSFVEIEEAPVNTPCEKDENDEKSYLVGWRLHVVTLALCLGLFLPNFEVSIVSTSLISITDDLKGFSQGSWIVTAYLITYTGLLIIWAKLSDIFGRKLTLTVSLVTFMVFSGACGASQTVEQLIICRAFQGIGGSGIYALGMIIFFEMIPPSQYTMYSGLVTLIFAISLAVGPVFGGLINGHTTWRWVFLLNIPAGAVAIVLLFFAFPANFPRHNNTGLSDEPRSISHIFSSMLLRKVDFVGAVLLLGGSIFLIAALQEVNNGEHWTAPTIIVLLVLTGPFWIAFLAWERRITRALSQIEPVFPWRFVEDPVWMGMIVNTFFTGTVFTICIISIPLRLQAVNGISPLEAGIRLLSYGVLVPVGAFSAAIIAGRTRIPSFYVLSAGAAFQIIGLALLSSLPTSGPIRTASYGFEVLAGYGTGLSIGTLVMLTPIVAEKRDLAVATAAINQFRFMGGSIGLALVTSVMFSSIRPPLLLLLPPAQVDLVLQTTSSIANYTPELQTSIREVFGTGFDLQMKITAGLAVGEVLGAGIMWIGTGGRKEKSAWDRIPLQKPSDMT